MSAQVAEGVKGLDTDASVRFVTALRKIEFGSGRYPPGTLLLAQDPVDLSRRAAFHAILTLKPPKPFFCLLLWRRETPLQAHLSEQLAHLYTAMCLPMLANSCQVALSPKAQRSLNQRKKCTDIKTTRAPQMRGRAASNVDTKQQRY